jgi:hypothetical protein
VALVSGGYGIYTSSNSGVTWTPSQGGYDWYASASSADGTKQFAVLNQRGSSWIYTSINSGGTWTGNYLPSVESSFVTSIASSSDGTKLFVGTSAQFGCGIFSSTNSGSTWTLTSAPNVGWASITASSDGTRLAAVPAHGGIYTSTNSGVTWIQTSAPSEGWTSIASSSDGTKLAAASAIYANYGELYGGIYTSTNSGLTWTPTSAPNENWYSIASSSDGTKLAAVVDGGGIYTGIALPLPGYNQIIGQLLTGGSLRLSFVGIAGTNYALDRTFNLSPANWVPQVTNPAGAGGVLIFTNAPVHITNNFWRIRSVP